MTEVVNGMNQTQELSQSQAPESMANEQAISNASERVFRQSEVNDIIKKAKYGAVEDYKRLQSQQPQYAHEKHGDSSSRYNEQASEDKIQQMIEEVTSRQIDKIREDAYMNHQRDMANRIVTNFRNKTQSGREKFEDFDAVTGDIELSHFSRVVELLADHVENADEVYYELGKDLLKMSGLQRLAETSMPAAIKEVQRFAKSLKENANAKGYRQPNEPLSQLRPSTTGTDVGSMSVSDFRKKYKV